MTKGQQPIERPLLRGAVGQCCPATGRRGARRWAGNVVALLTSLMLALLFAEGGTRLLYPVPLHSTDTFLAAADGDGRARGEAGTRLRPDTEARHQQDEFDVGVRINSKGLRDDELPYEKPAAYTRDYLQVLNAAIAGPGEVDVENDTFTVHNPTVLSAESPMPVLVAALGPVMLQIAGEMTDGTVLWMADERAIGDHIAPRINKAAQNAGRPAPRIVAGIPVCLCANSEIDAAKDRANRILAEAETSPNYQKLLDRGDARNVGDLCAAGDEEAILARFRKFADAGVTDLSVRLLPIGETRDELIASKYRTREVISQLADQIR